MYRGIIQQRADITEYLRDQIVTRKLEQPIGLGRIYRVVHETTRRDTSPALSTATPAQLVDDAVASERLVARHGAAPARRARRQAAVVPALVRLAESAKDPRTRLHALWTLDGIDAIEPATVTKALDDPSRDVRVVGDPDRRALARRGRTIRFRRRC